MYHSTCVEGRKKPLVFVFRYCSFGYLPSSIGPWVLVLSYCFSNTGPWVLALRYWSLGVGPQVLIGLWILVLRNCFSSIGPWVLIIGSCSLSIGPQVLVFGYQALGIGFQSVPCLIQYSFLGCCYIYLLTTHKLLENSVSASHLTTGTLGRITHMLYVAGFYNGSEDLNWVFKLAWLVFYLLSCLPRLKCSFL